MTLEEELINHISEICGCVENCWNCKYHGFDGQCHQLEYLEAILKEREEELKELRENYKNVSEAYMKCNLELFRLMKAREE